MKKKGISLVVIVKNEAQRIASFLSHHQTLCSEAIVLDTGSTDDTVRVAKDVGALVYHFDWCDDFSAARNAALKLANYNWALCIDADERIAKSSFHQIKKSIGRKKCCYVMPQRNYYNNPQHAEWVPVQGEFPDEESGYAGYFVAMNTKLFSLSDGIFFEGRVHENVLSSAKRSGVSIENLPVPIHHYGYVISEEHNQFRNVRYGKLLEMKIKEHPTDVQAIEEYATHLIQVGKAKQALPLLKRLNDEEKTNANITRARILLGSLTRAAGNIDEAATIYRRAVEKDPGALFARVELLKFLATYKMHDDVKVTLDAAMDVFGEHPQLLREQSRYLIETRQIHQAAVVTRRVASLFPSLLEYAQLASRCEALSAKVKEMEQGKR